MNEAKNYVLSHIFNVNLWEGTTFFYNHQDSHSARLEPVFGEPIYCH